MAFSMKKVTSLLRNYKTVGSSYRTSLPSSWGIYGEWCSIECFWNDLPCQMTRESETDCKNKNTTLRQKIEYRSPSYLYAP